MIDLKPLWDSISTQVIILLAIVALGLIVVGVATQGFGRTIITVIGIFVLITCILMLGSATEVGTWIKEKIFKLDSNAGVITNFRLLGEVIGVQLHARI